MPKVSFDGTAKIIQVTLAPINGLVSLGVQADIYSAWVDWCAENPQYLFAFRFVGSDPISSTKNLGITFFLINGWHIRPYEADHRFQLIGNLFTDPSGYSPIVPTINPHNIVTEYSVSNLSDTLVVSTSGGILPSSSNIAAAVRENLQIELQFMSDLVKKEGLIAGTPAVVSPTGLTAGNISQTYTQNGDDVIVERI